MISLTRLSGKVFILNADVIERIDSVPDTVITLVDGTKYVVSEAVIEVIDEVIAYRREVRAQRAAHVRRTRAHALAAAPLPRAVNEPALRVAP